MVQKIRGRIHYFGVDLDSALQKYLDEKDDLQAGRQPRRLSSPDTLTTEDVVNLHLVNQEQRATAGDIKFRTFRERRGLCRSFVDIVGRAIPAESLGPAQFSVVRFRRAESVGSVAMKNALSRIKSIFIWAFESDILSVMVKFGPDFKPPSQKTLRAARQTGPQRLNLLTSAG